MNAKALRRVLKIDYLSQPSLENDQWALIFVGSLFWWMASWSPDAFAEDLYGHFALRFQAEAWAMAMMAPAALVLIGLQDPVKRWMVGVGAALQVLQFGALGYSAIFTGGEPIIGVFAWLFFARQYARMMWSAIIDP
jgi:hypothetical protein